MIDIERTIVSKPFDAATKRLVESQPSAWLNYLGLSSAEATLMETDVTTVTSEADRIQKVFFTLLT